MYLIYQNLPSSTLNCPLIGFPEYSGLLPAHPPHCSQSDLSELKILSCHLSPNSTSNSFMFPVALWNYISQKFGPQVLECRCLPSSLISHLPAVSVSSASFNCPSGSLCPNCLDFSPSSHSLMSFVRLISFFPLGLFGSEITSSVKPFLKFSVWVSFPFLHLLYKLVTLWASFSYHPP